MSRLRSILFIASLSGMLFSGPLFAQQTPATDQYQAAAAAYQSGNFVAAEKLWTELANQGNANAQYAMGIMNLKKEAQNASDQTAFRYLIEAAKNQHLAAMFNLGVAYWEGRGTQRQPEKATNWWELAAEREDAGAQYNLGLAYYLGQGRQQDTAKARYWAERAMKNGHPQAKPFLDKVATAATPPKAPAIATAPAPGGQANTASAAKTVANGNKTSASAPAQQAQAPAEIKLAKPLVKSPEKARKSASTPSVLSESKLRAAPNTTAASMVDLQAGTAFKLLKRGENWSKIQLSEPYPVWVHESLLVDLGNGKGEIKGNNVNIRPTPSTDKARSPALGQMHKGDIVTIRSKRTPWVEIISPEPFPGWIRNDAISAP